MIDADGKRDDLQEFGDDTEPFEYGQNRHAIRDARTMLQHDETHTRKLEDVEEDWTEPDRSVHGDLGDGDLGRSKVTSTSTQTGRKARKRNRQVEE